ncbi:filamentous hemagglutinin N-terminal domain-containing protein [Pseudomonas aeruginosa]|nr:filamentous hemagglutinin N-terminal domain-containing protein [Pseudomonas aeruginosa]HCF3154369.1 filamentous hemagglutinin N-terminal domain-containing protein [Pseudomonas aeruginosa]HDR2971414.1 filamentous hemagglutinin N-terminal domain-containing protein [Pseudomonas aeruginosa]
MEAVQCGLGQQDHLQPAGRKVRNPQQGDWSRAPSKIYGAVTSNGQLILVNPNGIMVGPKAHISSSALVASAGFLTEEQARQFAETGKLNIQLTGNVSNEGCITVHDNGMVALLGAQVNNAGVVQARKGKVQLATGPQAALDFHGDGLLNIAIGGEPGGNESVNADLAGGVSNSGEIEVGNGTVAMSAARAAKHLDSVVHISGNVVADSVTEDGGTIVLGDAARTQVAGTLSAKGKNGGQIKVLGDEVTLAGTARVDASGKQSSGGEVLVGGSFQGKGSEPASKATTVAHGAQLKADGKSDGGRVVVWSDGKTQFSGSASATGQRRGGVVETSGKQLTVAADAKVTASGGQQSGKWLLDPETVNIEADGGAPGSGTVAASAIAAGLQANDVEISASQRINVNSAIVSGDAGYHTLRLLADGKVAPASVYTDTGDPFADAKRNDSGSIYINAPILLKDGHLYIAASGDVLLNNTTGSQTGDAGYMGRAIIDVGNGTVWIKTSKSASVIQQEGTALIGKQVAVEGASVLLDSPLNHAGTLAGKATNGKFLYNQTSNGDVNTGTVRIDHGDGTSETMEGVSSSAIAKLGEQWIWERTGDTPHHLTLDETTPFQYLVFEALEYVDHKDHKPIAGDRTDSDYWVSSLTFKNPATGDVWVVSSDPTSTSGISVSRNGEATTEMPPGFALGTDLGSVTASANGWGVTGGTGDQGNPAASNAINRHGAANTSDKLVVDLGSNTSSVDANANELWHSGNKYESGVVSFLGSKDTSEKGGVTLKSQTAQLQGTIADAQREYGEANPAFSASVGVPGDASENSRAVKGVDDLVDRQLNQNRFDVKVSPTTTATVESNVGDYRVDGSVQADGFVGQRYQTTVKPGTLHVTPAELIVTAKDKEKSYGDADPALSYQVSGLKNGDTREQVLSAGSVRRDAGENVGNYAITNDDLALLSSNYILQFQDGVFSITPAELTVDADGKTKVYGDFDPALTYRVNGLKNGDSQTEVLSGLLQRAPGEDVGSYDIRQGSLDLASGKGQNYVLSFTGNEFTITPARLTVTADSQTKVYGDLDPTLTYTVAGLKNADSQAEVLNGGALNRAPGEAVGDYGISQGDLALNQGKGGNYVLSFVKGNLAITPATLTVEAQDQSKVYGNADPALTHVVHGLKNGDSAADVLNDGSLARVAGEDVGQYRIHQGSIGLNNLQGSNYVLQFVDGSLTITPASLSVTANDQSRVYGDLDPALTFSINGLKGGDSVADVLNGGQLSRQPGEDVGTYEIGQGELGLGGSKGQNYILSYEAGTFTVTPATLTVRADDRSKVYGEIDPTLSYQVSGLKRGDTSPSVLKGALRREAGENVKADGYTIGQATWN